jgi:ATP-dependent DNA helicase RecQ
MQMIKVFTLKFENSIEGFDDSALSNFLPGKDLVRWECRFFRHVNELYWTVIVEYKVISAGGESLKVKKGAKRDEKYKDLLSKDDWPLFNHLRDWRAEKAKKEGVPLYIIFNNLQLAKITAARASSLNALQQIEGIGNSRKQKYGGEVTQLIKNFGASSKLEKHEENNG